MTGWIRLLAAWAAALACAAWAAVRLLDVELGYPGTPLMAFAPVAAAVAAAVALLALVSRVRLAAAVAAVSAVALAAAVAPRITDDRPDDTAARIGLRVLTANVGNGRVSGEVLVRLVRRHRVDVLALQEVTPILDAALRSEGRERDLLHAVSRPAGDSAGIALYSRHPLTPVAPPPGAQHPISAGRLRLPSGSTVDVLSVHPPAPTSSRTVAAWHRELGELPPARPAARPRVIAGDFNSTLDHAEFRALLETGYADAAERDGAGLGGTWPHGRLVPPPVAIDHVLVDEACAVIDAKILDIAPSDHRAVLATLDLASCL